MKDKDIIDYITRIVIEKLDSRIIYVPIEMYSNTTNSLGIDNARINMFYSVKIKEF